MSELFNEQERQLLATPRPIPILKLKPGESRVVQIGSQPFSRRLVCLHFSLAKNRSVLCAGPGICSMCREGIRQRVFLYLACRTHNGAKVVACVSREVANRWLEKVPDFHHQFAIERPKEKNQPTTVREITTHGRFAELWYGFPVASELIRIFDAIPDHLENLK